VRFVCVSTTDGPRTGVLRENGVVEVSPGTERLSEFFGDDGTLLHQLGERIHAAPADEANFEAAELLRPIDPIAMRDFMAFEEHVLPGWRRAGLTRGPDVWYERPIGYLSNAANLYGPTDAIEIPGGSGQLDFELEIGAIIGRTARSVAPERAGEHIAGYVVLCDWSARDVQFREMEGRLGPFKGKDFGSSLGPILVTPDEIEDVRSGTGYDLEMISRVNDRVYGSDTWSSIYWSVEELVSYASWNSCVETGSLIGSGTCQGGCILELSLRHGEAEYPWLVPDDVVNLQIERLGAINARIAASVRGPWPGVRRESEGTVL
jgi:2-keto-4-pentenoate hydratase/2-oxohepta-3-ene-1,7-dioic acid hydratase in catechol pathway